VSPGAAQADVGTAVFLRPEGKGRHDNHGDRGEAMADFWQVLAAAVALVFIIEGLLPFISPGRWRHMLSIVNEMDDRVIRNMGLASMVLGVVLLYLVH